MIVQQNKRQNMKLVINHWSPKDNKSSVNRFYIKSDSGEDFGYIQLNLNRSKINNYELNCSENIKISGNEEILNKIINFQKEKDLHSFLIAFAQNAIVIGSKQESKNQKTKILDII